MNNEKLKKDLIELCDIFPDSEVVFDFKQRVEERDLTIQENPESHFCVYFAAFD